MNVWDNIVIFSLLLAEGTTKIDEFCFTMIRRADIEESEINLAMNAWQKEKAKISTGQQC